MDGGQAMTRKYAADFSDRHKYLGASEVAWAVGMGHWEDDPQKLWRIKTLREPRPPHLRIFDRGHAMEPFMAEMFATDYGMTVKAEQEEFINPAYPFIVSHVDGITPEYIEIPGREPLVGATGPGVVEFKAPGSAMVQRIKSEGLTSDNIIQMQLNCLHAGTSWGVFGFLDYNEWETVAVPVKLDVDFTAKILTRAAEFWSCVIDGEWSEDEIHQTEPPLLPKPEGVLEVSKLDGDLRDLMTAKGNLETAKTLYAEACEPVKKLMGDFHKKLVAPGMGVSYTQQKDSETTDAKGLRAWTDDLVRAFLLDEQKAEDMAQLWAREKLFIKTRKGSRPFKVTLKEEP